MSSEKDQFPKSCKLLATYFDISSIQSGQSLILLKQNSGIKGLCDMLYTSPTKGIDPSTQDLREKHFGKNQPYTRERHSILHIIWDALQDTVLQILILAAIISLVIGVIQDPESGWIEGVVILIAVLIVLTVTATNDYIKDGQFIKLSLSTNIHRVIVTRDNREQEIPASGLVVGDLMHITPGEVLNVDGVLVKSTKVTVDESSISGESSTVYKQTIVDNQETDPFLISGSKIIEGYGMMIVCGVGVNSINEKIRQISGFDNEEEQTPLQERLGHLAILLGKIGLIAGIIMTFVLILYTSIEAIIDNEWTSDETSEIISAFIIGIIILVVAIPEGLPLALTLSMAYSVIRMKEENIFVRHIRGCEVMGAATNILTDKTGTLTENKMKVTESEFFCKKSRNGKLNLNKDEENLLCKVICRNTTAFFKDVNGVEEISGSRTEGALIDLDKALGQDIYVYRDAQEELFKFAFTSESKKMTTVYNVYNQGFEVYTKGAAEIVLPLCEFYQSETGRIEPLDQEEKTKISEQMEEFAKKKLRVLALAYKASDQNPTDLVEQQDFEQGLIYIGLIGMQDKVRKEARNSVIRVQNAGITVRMITGDNTETAISVAQATGILENVMSKKELSVSVMTGKEFREQSGGLNHVKDINGEICNFKLNNIEQFHETIKYLRVISRCSPEDKLLLTVGLKELGEVVAAIGDGSNDAAALKQSDLGIAMMSGTQLAKQCSDIILLDDNFNSVLNTVKWGRNVYASTRKFLQFQLIVNIVALFVSILGGATLRSPPITAVQMLWVNLIMDSFAALALATEPPTEKLLESKPFGRTENIISKDMILTITTQCIYQIIVLSIILYLGPDIFDIDEGWGSDDWSEENGKHYTIFFHTFVMLQIFNEINCRKISMFEMNVFKDFFNNWMFQAIFWGTFAMQIIIVEFGGKLLNCSKLSFGVHLVCIGVGISGLVFGVLVRVFVRMYRMKDFKTSCKKERYDDRTKLLDENIED